MHLLTFPIEEWFHVLDNPSATGIEQWINSSSRVELGVRRLLDLCDRDSAGATVFVPGSIAETVQDVVAEIASRGHKAACYCYRHKFVYTQTQDALETDLTSALDRIENAVGKCASAYRAPGFSITSARHCVFRILARDDIEVVTSAFATAPAHGYTLNLANRLDYLCQL